MFILTNGKVTLQPFKVTYEQEFKKVVKEGGFDDEKQEYIKPVIDTERRSEHCYFADLATASSYAEVVNGTVEDLSPPPGTIAELGAMTFESFEEVKAFIDDGVRPIKKMTHENLVRFSTEQAQQITDLQLADIEKGQQMTEQELCNIELGQLYTDLELKILEVTKHV